jgi:dihydrofolate reductase
VIAVIWAQAANGVIGSEGGMPWHLPEDLAHFRACTAGATVVMGRRTWESLPERFRPLPGRRNVVLTRRRGWSAPGAETAADLAQALAARGGGNDGDVWVMGGAEVYAQAVPLADRLEITDLDRPFDGDRRAPAIGPEWIVHERDPRLGWHESGSGVGYRFTSYRRRKGCSAEPLTTEMDVTQVT